jgi:hypothetical protein
MEKIFIKACDSNLMKNYIMYQFHEEFNSIIGTFDVEFQSYENLTEYFFQKYGGPPISILFFWNFSEQIFSKIRKELPETKIILWTDDIHYFSEESRDIQIFCYKNCDYLISHYDMFHSFYNIEVSNKLWHSFHSCSEHFYKENINLNSKNLVYFYGADDPNHYPLRVWFKKKMSECYPDKIKIKLHPGYHINGFENSLQTSKELYEYSFCYTSGLFPKFEIKEKENSDYYLVGKFFEICGSGVLLLCNNKGVKSQLEKLGFVDKTHYLHIDDNNFLEILEWIFDKKNKGEILKIRENGHKLVINNHLTQHRCKKLNEKFSSLQ